VGAPRERRSQAAGAEQLLFLPGYGDACPRSRLAQNERVTDWSIILLGVVGGLILLWACLIVALWLCVPDEVSLKETLRLLPDLIRLLKRLASDGRLPTGVRVRLALLLAYLALPIDIVPDFIPVLGYADDAIIVAFVLRSVVRRGGDAALAEHWPGTPEGLAAVRRLCRPTSTSRPPA